MSLRSIDRIHRRKYKMSLMRSIFSLLLVFPLICQAETLQGRCKSMTTGTDLGFVYGGTYAELISKCRRVATSPIVDNVTRVACDPTTGACGASTATRSGDALARSVQIPRSQPAEIHSPACGDGRWSKCASLCLEAPEGTTLQPTAIQISEAHGIGCIPFDKENRYVSCSIGDGDCGAYSGLIGVVSAPKRFCATAKNWSGSWARCFRIEAQIKPDPVQDPASAPAR
jgi:hypothetical protein